jgi:hypothetical protein
MIFCNKLVFYGEGLLAPWPTLKLDDHSLSFVHDCLFNLFIATLHPQPKDPSCCSDKGTHLTWANLIIKENILAQPSHTTLNGRANTNTLTA